MHGCMASHPAVLEQIQSLSMYEPVPPSCFHSLSCKSALQSTRYTRIRAVPTIDRE